MSNHYLCAEVSILTDHSVPRDRWGRPMLYPPEGGARTSYTRVSTAAKWLDDKGGLINWTASQAMVGLIKSRPLQARVASIVARTQSDTYRENKAALKEIVENATQIAQASGRADFGTAVHEMSELLDSGTLDWSYVPDSLKGPLEAYQGAMSAYRILDSEVFVTVDEQVAGNDLHIAGSMDRIIEHPEFGPVVADLKTGADEPKYPLGVTTQVAIYARGLRYRDAGFPGTPEFDDGEPNSDRSAYRKALWPNINKDVGLMIHCPLEKVKGSYICHFYLLDLVSGWEALELGTRIQAVRRPPKLKRIS